MQKITSASTSVNRSKVPAIYRSKWTENRLRLLPKALDYGCGKYDTGLEYARTFGCEVMGYDPYNRTPEENSKALQGKYPLVLCSNVLNVIPSWEDRFTAVAGIVSMCEHGAQIAFTVYEGDGSGQGRKTGPDQWQENRKLSDYLEEIRKYLNALKVLGGCTGYCGPHREYGVIHATILKGGE